MKSFIQAFSALAVVAIIAGIGFMFGRYAYPKCPTISILERIDTVIVRDSIRDTVLVPVNHYIVRVDTIQVNIAGDTMLVSAEVPIQQKIYQTDDYRAVIEGFRPELVAMEVYRQTHYITKIETVPMLNHKRWGIGLYAGYGVTTYNKQVIMAPIVGVGISYSLIRW